MAEASRNARKKEQNTITFNDFTKQVQEEQVLWIPVNGFYLSKVNFNNLDIPSQNYSIEYFKEQFGRQWKMRLKRMIPLLKILARSDIENKPVMLATTILGKKSKDQFTTRQAIEDFKSIHLIKTFSAFYSAKEHRGRFYKVNLANFLQLKSLVSDLFNREELYIGETHIHLNKDIKFTDTVTNIKKEEEEELEQEESSPQWLTEKVRELVLEQNNLEKDAFFRYKFPKGCMRAYSEFCYQPTREKDHKVEHDQYREDILELKFPNIELHEVDRIASIHNLNITLKTGKIAGNNRETDDFYKLFSGRNLTKEERNNYKTLMMTFYFSNQKKWNSLVQHVIDYYYHKDNRAQNIALKGSARVVAAWDLMGKKSYSTPELLAKALKDFYKENKQKLEDFEGGVVGKDIFLYENVQNLSTEVELRKLGYIVETVYDGFYTDAPEEVWWKVYKEQLLKLKSLIKREKGD